jgi:hypothetical protein
LDDRFLRGTNTKAGRLMKLEGNDELTKRGNDKLIKQKKAIGIRDIGRIDGTKRRLTKFRGRKILTVLAADRSRPRRLRR